MSISDLSSRRPTFKNILVVLLSFSLISLSNRILTPNGDRRNDIVTFILNNPADVAVSGKIFNLRGMHIADMPQGTIAGTLIWDGKSVNGAIVPTGVYVYSLQSYDSFTRGTVVVVR